MKNSLIPRIVILIFFVTAYPQTDSQSEFEKYKKEREKEFSAYQESITLEFEKYLLSEKQAFDDYKNGVEQKWKEFKGSSNKVYVTYDEELKNRISVDFEAGSITVEVLLDKDEQSIDNANEEIKETIVTIVKEKAEDDKPILMDQLTSIYKKEITYENVKEFSGLIFKKEAIKIEHAHKGKDNIERELYTAIIPMKKNHLSTRIKRFEQTILTNTSHFKIDPAIIFAIIETESAFNPKAKSHVPAYGLMQLVPNTGARDAYNYLYKMDKFLTSSYLYDPLNNIELGCAYYAMIKYKYFNGIKDEIIADICAISSYNTGIGNVSFALSGVPILREAVKTANKLDANEVYNRLKNRLKSPEARNYIDMVWQRKEKYVHYR